MVSKTALLNSNLAPWRSPLAHALHRNRARPDSRYLQWATVRPDGRPANRTVVFRGFVEDSDQLIVVSDGRSQKNQDLSHYPWAEVCWYFPKTREQFRLLGRVEIIDPASVGDRQGLRHQIWRSLSEAARQQFAWPEPAAPRAIDAAFQASSVNPDSPLLPFTLLLLDPQSVDHLELQGEPQNRRRYQQQSGPDSALSEWCCEIVNP